MNHLLSKLGFPALFDGRTVTDAASRDVGQVYVAASSVAVPGEHGVDCLGKLRAAGLVDVTRVHLKAAQAVLLCLIAAKLEFLVACLLLGPVCVLFQVSKGDIFVISAPGVR